MLIFKPQESINGLLNLLNWSSSSGRSKTFFHPSWVKSHSAVLLHLSQCSSEWNSTVALTASMLPSFCLSQLTELLLFDASLVSPESLSTGSLLKIPPRTLHPPLAITFSLSFSSHPSFLRKDYIQSLHFLISRLIFLFSLFSFSKIYMT